MDNKKLMHILLRDVRELEELVVEMHQAGSCDLLDMELLRTRMSGVRHLLEAVTGMKEEKSGTTAPTIPIADTPPPPQVKEKEKEKAVPVTPKEIPLPEKTVPSPGPVTGGYKWEDKKPSPEEKPLVEDVFSQANEIPDEKEIQHEKQTLGEKFTAGKSVHDLLMLEKTKSDLKFSNIPIHNLANAIGTNDRFLFTRELFDGNMEQFNETVRQLDAMKTIREAVDFLQEHFQWKKSETSNKFLELVKRRFL